MTGVIFHSFGKPTVVVGKMAFAGSKARLQTVSHVDLARYLGRWYEIARYPARFEKDCASDVAATYAQLSGGKIEVLNECRKADGQVKSSKGTARVVDKNTNAKLKVTFFWPSWEITGSSTVARLQLRRCRRT